MGNFNLSNAVTQFSQLFAAMTGLGWFWVVVVFFILLYVIELVFDVVWGGGSDEG